MVKSKIRQDEEGFINIEEDREFIPQTIWEPIIKSAKTNEEKRACIEEYFHSGETIEILMKQMEVMIERDHLSNYGFESSEEAFY